MQHFYQNIGENWFNYPDLYTHVINLFGDGSHFVEVGSWKGRSAAFMAVEIHNSGFNIKFDCVDTWKGSIENQQDEFVMQDSLYEHFLENIQPVRHLINPIRKPSLEAAKDYEDGSLDFVFVDASHEYEDVKDDLIAWYPKVRAGGIIAGHDINHEPVHRAVLEFFPQDRVSRISATCWISTIPTKPKHNENND